MKLLNSNGIFAGVCLSFAACHAIDGVGLLGFGSGLACGVAMVWGVEAFFKALRDLP